MLFFDLDGTLLDSNGVWLDIDVEFLGRQGISPVPADYTDYVAHHSAPDAARYTKERFGLPHSPQEILDAWMELAREAYAHTLPLKPGAKEFLLRCHQAGERMAVLTSCMPPLCQAALERHGLLPLLERVEEVLQVRGHERREVRARGRLQRRPPPVLQRYLPGVIPLALEHRVEHQHRHAR